MKISEASRISGASARSLRHYEDEGLIVPGRCNNGFRDYCQSTVDRILVVRSLLDYGLPIRLIKEVLSSYPEAKVNAADPSTEFLREVERYRDQLAARIARLRDRQTALDAYLFAARQAGS